MNSSTVKSFTIKNDKIWEKLHVIQGIKTDEIEENQYLMTSSSIYDWWEGLIKIMFFNSLIWWN